MPVMAAPFPGVCQLGYVTNDMDRATASLSRLHGIGPFVVHKDIVTVTHGDREALLDLAFAFVGAIELEVIQPRSGDIAVWRDVLPQEGYGLRLHHVCSYFEDELQYEAMREQVKAEFGPLTFDSQGKTGRRFYADCRATLGHYVEGTLPSDLVRQMRATVPRY